MKQEGADRVSDFVNTQFKDERIAKELSANYGGVGRYRGELNFFHFLTLQLETMSIGFIENVEILREDSRKLDLLDYSETIKHFSNFLDSIIHGSSIIAFIGEFGSGKSTLLYNVQKQRESDREKWIVFDAWKFPERKDLWEGFVLEFTRQLCPVKYDKTKKTIDGKQYEDKKTLLGVLAAIPGLSVIKNLEHFFQTSPARRVFDIQEILTDIIKKEDDKEFYVVIEDIDRSGDYGIYFLETMKQFVSNLDSKNKLTVLVPMSNKKYEDGRDSFLKCIDYFEYFNYKNPNLNKFVNTTFRQDYIKNRTQKNQLISFLETLFTYESTMTPRLLMSILRKANNNFTRQEKDGLQPDFRVSILFEASKHFKDGNGILFFDTFKRKKAIFPGNIFSSFLGIILDNMESLQIDRGQGKSLIQPPHKFKLLERQDIKQFPSIPWEPQNLRFANDEDEKYFGNCDFYLNY